MTYQSNAGLKSVMILVFVVYFIIFSIFTYFEFTSEKNNIGTF